MACSPRRDGGAVRRADWLRPQRAAQWGGCGGGRGRGALAVRTFFSGARSPLPFLSTSPSWRSRPMGAGEGGGPSAAVGRRVERRGARPIAARGSPLPAAGRGGISRGTEKRAAFRRGGRAAVTPSAPLAFPAGRARGRAHPEPTAGRERASAGRRRFEVRGAAALGGRGAVRWCVGGGAAIRRGGAGPGAAASPHSRCACVSVCMYVCVCVRAGGARHGGSGGRGERRWARCGTEPPAPRSAPCAGPPQPRLAPPRSARPSQLRARPTSRAFPAPVSCFRGSPDSSKRARGGFPRRAARTLIQSTCRIPPASPPPSHKSTALGTAPRCGGSWQLRLRSPSPHLPAVLPIPLPGLRGTVSKAGAVAGRGSGGLPDLSFYSLTSPSPKFWVILYLLSDRCAQWGAGRLRRNLEHTQRSRT